MKGKKKFKVKINKQYLSYGIIAVLIVFVLIVLSQVSGGYLKTQVITDDIPIDPYPTSSNDPVKGACYHWNVGDAAPGFAPWVCSDGTTTNECQLVKGAFSADASCLPEDSYNLVESISELTAPCAGLSNTMAKQEKDDCVDLLKEKLGDAECKPGETANFLDYPSSEAIYDTSVQGAACFARCQAVVVCSTGYASYTPVPENPDQLPS